MKRTPLNFKICAYIFAYSVNAFLPCVISAQTNQLAVPNYATNSQIPNSGDAEFASVAREQTVFGAAEFPPYPIVISKIQWRPDTITGAPVTNAFIANIQINLSTTPNSAGNLNSVFAQNVGTDDIAVFTGGLNLSTAFITLGNGTKAFDIDVPLQTPFTYDPSKGNLLVDVRNFTGCTKNIFDNSTDDGLDTVSRIFSSDVQATTAEAGDTGGGVMQITFTSTPPPSIIVQPTNFTVSIDAMANFVVAAIGAQPISYQWYFNDTNNPIEGATNSSFLLDDVQTNQRGIYLVRVTNGYGLAFSSNALLTVTPAFVSTQPISQVVAVGETASFIVAAQSGAPLSYQWFFNNTGIILNATNSFLIITNVQPNQAGLYSVQITNIYGVVASSNASLDLGFIVPNYGRTFQTNTNAEDTFVDVLRTQTIYGHSEFPPYPILISELRWRPDDSTGRALTDNIPNIQINLSTTATNADHLNSTFAKNTGTNDTLVFNGTANLFTSFTTLSNSTKGFDISLPLQSRFVFDSSKGNLLVDIRDFSGGSGSLYTSGLTTSTDTVSRIFSGNANSIIANGADSRGEAIQIIYTPAPLPPTISAQPTNQVAAAGTTIILTVAASGAPPLSYRWFFNDFDHPLDDLNNSLILVNVQTNQSGSYFVQVSDNFGSVQSLPATITVLPGPRIISQPLSQTVAAGGTSIFNITAQGEMPITYQWFFNNTNVILGATNDTLIVTNVQANQLGLYSVRVSNSYGSVDSSNANLMFGLIIPNYATNYQIGNNGEVIFVEILRVQTVYGASQFPEYPVVIKELRWRPDSITGGPLTDNVPNIQINLSTTATNADHMSTTFSKNIGTNDTLVFSGTMTASTSFITLSNGTKTFDISLPLQIPFVFEPSKGNLLVDLRNFGGGAANLYNNTVSTSTDTVSRVYNAGNANGISTTGSDTGGAAMQIVYTPAPFPPTISSQPTNRSVIVGNTVSFSAVAGPEPLSYQWFYNTNALLNGETNASLMLTNVQLNQAGTYSVVVSNAYGPTTSALAVLTATFPPVNIFIGNTNLMGGNLFTVPVLIAANGNENSVSFSLNFNTQQVTYAGVELGSGATDGSLLSNISEAVGGRLGVTMQLPFGETFSPGTQEVVRVTFLSALVSGTQVISPINFTNQPINRFVIDGQGNKLATNFINGNVTLTVSDLEGDTSPRTAGDRSLDIFDWSQVGRFVAGLDLITNAAEFQRADVAPKSTSGDGQLKVTDWVQAGRYGAIVDGPTVIGGPTAPVTPTTLIGGPRTINIVGGSGVKGLNVTVPIILQSQGNENGLGFSVNFDPATLKYVSTVKGSAAGTATLLVNTNQATSGTVGVLVALQAGNSFTNGIEQEIAKLTFTALNTTSNGPVALINGPVLLSISDPLANELSANYLNGSVTINPPPTLTAGFVGSNATLSWPIWGTGFNMQATGDLLTQGWTNVAYLVQTNGNNIIITIPTPAQNSYFRLRSPQQP